MESISTYSLLPLVGSIFVITLGFFVWLKRPKEWLHSLFLFYCFTIAIWLFGTFQLFNAKFETEQVFWDRIIYVGVVFIPIFLYHFGLIYCGVKKQRWILIFGYLLSFFFLPISQTDYFVEGVFKYSWGVHTVAQIFHHYFLVYFFFYFVLFFINLAVHYWRSVGVRRQQVRYILLGFGILDLIGPLAFLPAYGVPIYPIIFLSAIPFALLLAYAIIRHNVLDMRVITAETAVTLLNLAVLAEAILAKNSFEFILRTAVLLIVFSFSIVLVRSVKKEIQRREEIQKLAAELKAVNEKLVELDQAKSDFLSIAAHQLRTPLTIIKGYISMIQEGDYGFCPNPKISRVLDNVYQSNEHLIHLVNDFLDVSRIDAGRTEYKFEKVSLKDILEEIAKQNTNRIKEKGLKLKLAMAKNLPKIAADVEKIHHVIFNFLSNSIKYTDKGFIKAELFRDGKWLVCQITDSGIGLTLADTGNLFQKFYRSENAQQKLVEGVGLGLFVCRKFIEGHHGEVFAKSPGPGKGSTFGFRVPVN